MFIALPASGVSNSCNDEINKISNNVSELKTANNPSPELARYLLQEALAVIDLIEKIDPEVRKEIGVRCKGCGTNILSCAELTGHLWSAADQKNLDELKKLLQKKNAQEIKDFMLTIANKKQVACVRCEKFIRWI
jgi:hypothetical protein